MSEVNGTAAARALAWRPPADEPIRSPIEKFTLAELREAYPTLARPVVQGIGRRGETCNINGDPKSSKSFLASSLLLSIVTGRDWLDTFPVEQGRALLVDNELPRAVIVSRIDAIAAAMGIRPSEYETLLDIWPLRGNLRSIGDLSFEFDDIEPGYYRGVVCDARYRFPNGETSENDNTATAAFYNQVDQLAAQTDAFWVLVHHANKGNQADKKISDVGAGAGAQSRAADAHLVLRAHEDANVYVMDGVVRSFAPLEPLAIRWEYPLWRPDTWADPAKLQGRQGGNDQRQQQRDREGMDAIIRALRGVEWLGMNDICAKANMGKSRAGRLIGQLEVDGFVGKDTAKIHHNEATVYRLIEGEV